MKNWMLLKFSGSGLCLRFFMFFCICFFLTASVYGMEVTDWREPDESDYKSDWETYKDIIKKPFYALADFNGDGFSDEAWILFSKNKKQWGLFVFLSDRENIKHRIELEINSMEIVPQRMGVRVLKAGVYKTVCAKTYANCTEGEEKELFIKKPSIKFFTYESASSVYYWDSDVNYFVKAWLSD